MKGRKGPFLLIGASAFALGAAMIEGLVRAGLSPYAAQLPVFLAGATWTWALNRRFTFAMATPPTLPEYWRYLMSSAGGLGISLAVCTILIALGFVPIAALAGGSVAGLLCNYIGYARFVFGPARVATKCSSRSNSQLNGRG